MDHCGAFISVQCACRRAPAPRCCGGQSITQVWGLVTGHHHPALCCCQESFTASNSLPNGTFMSIKTIIAANPTQSREIISACQCKHGQGVSLNLSEDLLDMQSAGQAFLVLILGICLVWMNSWLRQGFSPHPPRGPGGLFLLGNRNPSQWVLDGVKTLINHDVFPPTTA